MASVPSLIKLIRGQRIDEYRLTLLLGLSVVLHTIVDPVVTYYMTISGATGYEANPFLRWALGQGLAAYIAVHIPVILLSLFGFYGFPYFVRRADHPSDKRLAQVIEIGSGVLIVWGLPSWSGISQFSLDSYSAGIPRVGTYYITKDSGYSRYQ